MAKWNITIEGLDLGSLIPAEGDLKPHDHPLESWAGETIHHVLKEMVYALHKRAHKARVEVAHASAGDELVTAEASVIIYEKNLALAEYLVENARVTAAE